MRRDCSRRFSSRLATILKDATLLRSSGFIAGAWVPPAQDSDGTFQVEDPATERHLASCSRSSQSDLEAAIDSAKAAFPKWSTKSGGQRSAALLKWSELILQARQDLAHIATLENGKPLREALGEVHYAASFAQFYGEEARRGLSGESIVESEGRSKLITVRQPVGVVAAITPWNFPLAMITRKAAAALSAGCTVVLKPSEHTPLSGLALVELARRAGIPAGVLNAVVTDDAEQAGNAFTSSGHVNKLTFTGSTAVGKRLLAAAAPSVKRVSLELGGNAPFIVTESADIPTAISALMSTKFRNAGQTCICPNRIFLQRPIADQFLSQLIIQVNKLDTGPGLENKASLGPLINSAALGRVQSFKRRALDGGAVVLTSEATGRHAAGYFFEPCVMTDVPREMLEEEIFGPIVSAMVFDDEDEVIRRANSTKAGLAVYLFSQDMNQTSRMAAKLDYGIVGINTGSFADARGPFGGMKESGLGREGSIHGLWDFTEIKAVHYS